MQQGASLKVVKQLCGFVLALVSITLRILFSRLHNNPGKVWHAILLKDQENSCVALSAVWKVTSLSEWFAIFVVGFCIC
jgi:hypothetical protein